MDDELTYQINHINFKLIFLITQHSSYKLKAESIC
jgi:hypothetical protein